MSHLQVQARLAARGVDVDLTVDEGRVLAVLGPNGVGKSTLLLLLAGLLHPDCGRVRLGDVVLTDTDAGTFVAPHRRGVALLSQQALLFPRLTVAAVGEQLGFSSTATFSRWFTQQAGVTPSAYRSDPKRM